MNDAAENYLGTVKMVRRWLLAAERELRQVTADESAPAAHERPGAGQEESPHVGR